MIMGRKPFKKIADIACLWKRDFRPADKTPATYVWAAAFRFTREDVTEYLIWGAGDGHTSLHQNGL